MARRRLERLERVLGVSRLVLALPRRIAGGGNTVETVLEERPCRVVIQARPPERPRLRQA